MRRAVVIIAIAACSSPGHFMTTPDSGATNDATIGGADATINGDAGLTTTPNYAFVTSTTYTIATLGGQAGADAACNERAGSANLGGHYIAWLSTSTSNAIDRLGSASGWIRPDGQPIAASSADLAAGRYWYPPELDEFGRHSIGFREAIWTGTDSGMATNVNCDDFTSTTGNVWAGVQLSAETSWATYAPDTCTDTTRLYCIGNGGAASVTIVAPSAYRFAFVTKSAYAPTSVFNGGGLAGVDTLCKTEATAASLPGTYNAYIPTSTSTAADRFTDGPPWLRTDFVPVGDITQTTDQWTSAQTLAADGSLLSIADVTIWGEGGSALAADTCGDWTSNASTDTATSFYNTVPATLEVACNSTVTHVLCLED